MVLWSVVGIRVQRITNLHPFHFFHLRTTNIKVYQKMKNMAKVPLLILATKDCTIS